MNRSQQQPFIISSRAGVARCGLPLGTTPLASRSVANRCRLSIRSVGRRVGFTLVELLVVIAIIGILIGMLAVSIGPVLTRVHDGAVTTEMKQLELAIENFNNQYGFYPPSFGGLDNQVRDNESYDLDQPWASDGSVPPGEEMQLLKFLNRISPNHRENVGMINGSSETPLRAWWVNIGRHLDDRSSLVFWLSGLTANKQFPLTGGLPEVGGNAQLPAAFGLPQSIILTGNGSPNTNADLAENDNGDRIDIPRDSFFDFRGSQLASEALDILTLPSDVSVNNRTSPETAPGIRVYNTPYGDARPNRGNAYFYREGASYNTNGGGFFALDNDGNSRFLNPKTFQIFTYGRDGLAVNASLNELDGPVGQPNRDNIANFANGRLEAFKWRESLGLPR